MHVIVFDGSFWTGTRFSPHIAEALKLSKPEARDSASYLNERLDIKARVIEEE